MSTRPGPPSSLTVDQIALAAVAVADEHGLAGLTMRRLADDLGVSAAGLYRYVASREVLLEEVVDVLVGGLEHPAPTGSWLADVVGVAHQQRALYVAHPWLPQAVAAVRRLGPRTLDHFDWGLAALAPVDAPAVTKMEALALVNGLAALFAGGGGTASGPQALSGISPTRHQHLVAALGAARTDAPPADLFERALASLLTGLLGATPAVRPSRPGGGGRPPSSA